MNTSFSMRKSYHILCIMNFFRSESCDIIRILFYDMMPSHSRTCGSLGFFESVKTFITCSK